VFTGYNRSCVLPDGWKYNAISQKSGKKGAQGDFEGGLSGIFIIRYSDTGDTVEPYSELLFSPGIFRVPPSSTSDGKSGCSWRITCVYVSSMQSVIWGRKNWGIPKYLANFKWGSEPGSSVQTVEITLAGENEPFFTATLTDSKYIPGIPFNTKYLPSVFLIQPKLKEESYLDPDDDITAAADAYYKIPVIASGKINITYISGQGGDGVRFPTLQGSDVLTVGAHLPAFRMDFVESQIL